MNLMCFNRHYPKFADFSTPCYKLSFHAGLLQCLIDTCPTDPHLASELQANINCKYFRLIFGVLPQCSLIFEDLLCVRIVSCAVSAWYILDRSSWFELRWLSVYVPPKWLTRSEFTIRQYSYMNPFFKVTHISGVHCPNRIVMLVQRPISLTFKLRSTTTW